MLFGVTAGITWALETILLGIALSTSPFVSSEQAAALAPFVGTFLHDLCSAVWIGLFNGVRGKWPQVRRTLKTRDGWFIALAAVIGGPVGMTGYVLSVSNLGASVGAVASAVYPAIGAVLAYLFLKEKRPWYRWIFLLCSLCGVFALGYSPQPVVRNFWPGLLGTLLCALGWGVEGVLISRTVRGGAVHEDIALQIRQTTSALIYGIVILPLLHGWRLAVGVVRTGGKTPGLIALAALAAAVSYRCYYSAIARLGTAKAMALNITYCAWSVVFSVLLLRQTALVNPVTLLCTAIVLCFGILAAADPKALFTQKDPEKESKKFRKRS